MVDPFVKTAKGSTIHAANGLDPERKEDKTYHLAYTEFVRYFADLNRITAHELIIGAHFTYGWMPRILRLRGGQDAIDHAAEILTQQKQGKPITDDDLASLAGTINNSFVGASKLLHFVCPDRYAIWDSRVCAFIYGANIVEDRAHEIQRYRTYLDTCHFLATDPTFPALHARICNVIGREVLPLRAIEWVMYRCGDTWRSDQQ